MVGGMYSYDCEHGHTACLCPTCTGGKDIKDTIKLARDCGCKHCSKLVKKLQFGPVDDKRDKWR